MPGKVFATRVTLEAVRALLASPPTVSTVSVTNVAAATSGVEMRPALVARRGLIVYNDSSATLFLKYGSSVSAASFTVKILGGGYWEMPAPIFIGQITGVWSVADGAARITETS